MCAQSTQSDTECSDTECTYASPSDQMCVCARSFLVTAACVPAMPALAHPPMFCPHLFTLWCSPCRSWMTAALLTPRAAPSGEEGEGGAGRGGRMSLGLLRQPGCVKFLPRVH